MAVALIDARAVPPIAVEHEEDGAGLAALQDALLRLIEVLLRAHADPRLVLWDGGGRRARDELASASVGPFRDALHCDFQRRQMTRPGRPGRQGEVETYFQPMLRLHLLDELLLRTQPGAPEKGTEGRVPTGIEIQRLATELVALVRFLLQQRPRVLVGPILPAAGHIEILLPVNWRIVVGGETAALFVEHRPEGIGRLVVTAGDGLVSGQPQVDRLPRGHAPQCRECRVQQATPTES